MGLKDIFKKTETENETEPVNGIEKEPLTQSAQETEQEGYTGDLEKTQALAEMLQVPREERNENWVSHFLGNLPLASLKSGTPQLIAGPDGFPYFQLFVPEPGDQYQSFIIDRMVPDFLVERGYGVVINPGAGQPDWVLTYGDILNYYLNGTFFTLESNFSDTTTTDEVVTSGEEILIGQPSESILPLPARKLLKDFFELNGIEDPKVLLMMRRHGEDDVTQDLAFNITPERFESEEHYRNMMQTVTWYLPRHYSIIGLNTPETDSAFVSL